VASATAARAADRASASLMVWPASNRSLPTARRGVGATHPMTIDAEPIVEPSMRKTTATSQMGQS